jgi:amino acid adenylation domain-containing protein
MNNKFSCFIIGTESHLIKCAEILIERGHQIYGIISSERLIIDWAEEQGIPYTEPDSDLVGVLNRQPFDYLFSIVYPSIIPGQILALPRKGAINFHDGPLPRYAGINATSWALINQEKTHGVTWHLMSAEVDQGDILKQRLVEVDVDETAFTLNAKCYQAGIESFAELVDELANGQVEVRKQNLAERTYFSKYKRPPAACAISWSKPADEIAAFVRALDFGTYTNPLGLPKLVMGHEIFILPQIEVMDANARAAPGTLTGIDDHAIRIATASKEVSFEKLLTIDGQPLSMADFAISFDLREGDRLPELDKDMADRLTKANGEICRHEAFWVSRLAKLETIELPYARHSHAQSTQVQHANAAFRWPAELDCLITQSIGAVRRNDFLVAAFAAYLARLNSKYTFDIGFSHPALKQRLLGIESFFATQVPLRVDLDPFAGFGSALEALTAQLALVKQRKTYVRDTILRYPELSSFRAKSGESSWSIIIEEVESFEDHLPLVGSDLTLLLLEDGADCCWVYDKSVLGQESLANMQRQFVAFLQNIVSDNNQPIAEVSLLDQAEYRKIMIEWNDTKVDYPRDRCIHQWFEDQAERTPDDLAVIFEEQQLTYREMNIRANQLAHYLRSIGVGPEVLVGIAVERSLEMVIGLYGILKAGGAYVPIDPTYPAVRLSFMLEDANVPVLLTQAKLLDDLPACEAKVICLDTDWNELIAGQSVGNPVCEVTMDNLAYTIYTSGSTGKPKGAMNTHGGILNRLLWMQDAYQLAASDRVLQKTPFSFDVSVWEFFWPLMFGARLVVARPEGHKDNDYLVQTIIQHEITTMHFVPSMLQLFLEAKDLDKCVSLRQIICSGEALSLDLQNRFFDRLNAELHNLYGPTEAAVDVTYWECQSRGDLNTVPIGRPIANTQIYILDRHLQPVPIGVPGEMHIGGLQVAKGYINRSKLTAEKFIPDPFSKDPEARLYKTGDLARCLPDGNIEFLGRLDFQVKVRGFRIELGEIESILAQHPAVREAVVVAREDIPGDVRLAAYLVYRFQSSLKISDLRDFLKEKLPEYMLPATFVVLEALPLTPNGKVDRRSLPAPEGERQAEEAYMAPRNELERIVAGLWRDLLQIEKVGIHDNFFDLGGNSLLVIQVHNRLVELTGREPSTTDMFRYPTIAKLTEFLIQGQESAPSFKKTRDRARRQKEILARRKRDVNRRTSNHG